MIVCEVLEELGEPLPYATPLTRKTHITAAQGNYEVAKPLYERSLAIRENVLGPDHPDVAASLNNLALLLESQVRVDSSALSNVRRSLRCGVLISELGAPLLSYIRHCLDDDDRPCGYTGPLRRRQATVRALPSYL